MSVTIPATEVKNKFGQVLRQSRQTDEAIFVENRGRPVAVILSIESYNRLKGADLTPDQRSRAKAAFGLWANRDDVGDEWLAKSREQWRSAWEEEREQAADSL